MRHEYCILWFEDDEDFVTDTQDYFCSELRELGFRLKLIHEEDISRFDILDFSEVDLILSDLNMDPESKDDDDTGEELIEKIRDKGILTEIFFYSGVSTNLENSVQRLSKDISHIQRLGIHAGRSGLEKKVISFIGASIRKLEDLNNMRGLVISQAIELENDIIQICSLLLPDPAQNQDKTADAHEVLRKRLDNKMDCNSCKEKYALKDSAELSFSTLLDRKLLTSSDKFHILKGYLKRLKSDCSTEQLVLINKLLKHPTFEIDFLDHRNIYAHQPVEVHKGKQILRSINKRADDITHDKEWCSVIRKNFLDYADLLADLQGLFKVVS